MNKPVFKQFDDKPSLDKQLADDVAALLGHAIDSKGQAFLVVSGGSTPLGFFQQLSQKPLNWHLVTISLADERWLEPSHLDSNEKLVRDNLLVNQAATAQFLPLKNSAPDAQQGAEVLQQTLANMGAIDVLILGMGGDGHTASLFPEAVNLSDGLNMSSDKQCIAIDPVTASYKRISMTLPRLLHAEQIIVHITGDEKLQLLKTAQNQSDINQYPISHIVQKSRVLCVIYWAG